MSGQKGVNAGYTGDYLSVALKTIDFMQEPKFDMAWQKAYESAQKGYDKVPDIRWRIHTAVWAAQHGLNLEGDFVECGVHTGFLSLAIAHYTEFQNVKKTMWLYDTWEGIPMEQVADDEKARAAGFNSAVYHKFDIFAHMQQAFAAFPNCKLVRGMLPDTLADGPDKIAYLSVDLNHTTAEQLVIENLWPKLVKGAIVVIDDYGWIGHEKQRKMWDAFAKAQGTAIGNLPTGQGLLIKI